MCVRLRISCPIIDVDTAVGNLMTGEQVFMLLQAINSLDPLDSNVGYDSIRVDTLAEILGVSREFMVKVCIGENVNLPFGHDTVLHRDVVDQVKRVIEYDFDKYDNEDEESADSEGSNRLPDIDVF